MWRGPGFYRSVRDVRALDFWLGVDAFVRANRDLAYDGLVILQEQVAALIGGVLLSSDASRLRSASVIEWLPSGSHLVTAGMGHPSRVVVDRSDGEVLEDTADESGGLTLDAALMRELLGVADRCEAH